MISLDFEKKSFKEIISISTVNVVLIHIVFTIKQILHFSFCLSVYFCLSLPTSPFLSLNLFIPYKTIPYYTNITLRGGGNTTSRTPHVLKQKHVSISCKSTGLVKSSHASVCISPLTPFVARIFF